MAYNILLTSRVQMALEDTVYGRSFQFYPHELWITLWINIRHRIAVVILLDKTRLYLIVNNKTISAQNQSVREYCQMLKYPAALRGGVRSVFRVSVGKGLGLALRNCSDTARPGPDARNGPCQAPLRQGPAVSARGGAARPGPRARSLPSKRCSPADRAAPRDTRAAGLRTTVFPRGFRCRCRPWTRA